MWKVKKKDRRDNWKKEEDALLEHLSDVHPADEDYDKIVKNLKTFQEARVLTQPKKEPISPNTMIVTGVGLLEVLTMVFWEQGHNLAKTALARMAKGKL